MRSGRHRTTRPKRCAASLARWGSKVRRRVVGGALALARPSCAKACLASGQAFFEGRHPAIADRVPLADDPSELQRRRIAPSGLHHSEDAGSGPVEALRHLRECSVIHGDPRRDVSRHKANQHESGGEQQHGRHPSAGPPYSRSHAAPHHDDHSSEVLWLVRAANSATF